MTEHDGWFREAYGQLSKRVDAVEDAVKQLVGRSPEGPSPAEREVKVGGVGLGTWIMLLSAVVVPIVVAIIATGKI